MRSRRFVLMLFGLFVLIAIVLVGTAASNAAGAPANAAKDGCTCHGTASGEASVSLQAPTEYLPGGVYDLKITLTGPAAIPAPAGQNAGGFALQVTAGSLSGGNDVKAEGLFATHSAAGNNQRTWNLKWTAPADAEVTFYLSSNAVNGDGLANQLDRWNKISPIAKLQPGAAVDGPAGTGGTGGTAGTSPGAGDSPFLPAALVLGVLGALAFLRRRD